MQTSPSPVAGGVGVLGAGWPGSMICHRLGWGVGHPGQDLQVQSMEASAGSGGGGERAAR